MDRVSVSVSELQDVLYRLLYHRSFRSAFVSHPASLELAPPLMDMLAGVDIDELNALTSRISRDVLWGSGEAGGGLARSYPVVLRILADLGVPQHELVARFLESECFRDYRDVPYGGEGVVLEEAFYDYARSDDSGLPVSDRWRLWLEHEFLTSLLSLFVLNPEPSFLTRTTQLRYNGTARYAVTHYPASFLIQLGRRPRERKSQTTAYLYAQGASTLVTGPVDPIIITIMELGTVASVRTEWPVVSRTTGVLPERLIGLAERLHRLGL